MATTRVVFPAFAAELPSSNGAWLNVSDSTRRRPVLTFDPATSYSCNFTFVAWQGLTGTLTVVISYYMASATSGGVTFGASIEAITDGDSTDLDAADSFDTENTNYAASVPGTAGYIDQISITCTNQDSIAAGDYCRLKIARKTADSNDTATGNACVLAVEIRDAA